MADQANPTTKPVDIRPVASDALLADLARCAKDVRRHQHPERGEDFYCLNLVAFMGERMQVVLNRIEDEQAKVREMQAFVQCTPECDALCVEGAPTGEQRGWHHDDCPWAAILNAREEQRQAEGAR